MNQGDVLAVLARESGRVRGERVRLMLSRLGNPEREVPVLQVGGTVGKGCVISLLESVLHAAGVRVGAFTSPEPEGVRHQLRVGKDPIGHDALQTLISRAVEPLEEFLSGLGRPTLPEALLAAAFSHFAREGVDLALVEVSQGGRYDPAGAVSRPLLSLVTSVEEDHRRLFGPGLAQAAWEEAGIARQGVPLLTTEDKGDVLATFAYECRQAGAALVLVSPEDVEPVRLTWDGGLWRSRSDPLGLGVFETRLAGAYQRANLALALGAAVELAGGLGLGRNAIREGLAAASPPGRFEVVSRRPYIVLDGAQNPAAARALMGSLDALPKPGGRKSLLFGITRDRLVKDVAEVLFPRFDEVVLVSGEGDGGLPGKAVAPQARRLAARWKVGGGMGETARELASGLAEDDLLVVCGDLPMLGEARDALARAA